MKSSAKPQPISEVPPQLSQLAKAKNRLDALSRSFDALAIFASGLSAGQTAASSAAERPFPYPLPRPPINPVLFPPVRAPYPSGSVFGDPSAQTTVNNTFGAASGVPISFAFVQPTNGLISLAVANGYFGFGSPTEPIDTPGFGSDYSNNVSGLFSYVQLLNPAVQTPNFPFARGQRVTVSVDVTAGNLNEASPDNSILLQPEVPGGTDVYVRGTANLILSAFGRANDVIYKKQTDFRLFLEKRLSVDGTSNLIAWVKNFSLSGHLGLRSDEIYNIEVDVSVTLYANRGLTTFRDDYGFAGVSFADRTDRMAPWDTPNDANNQNVDRSIRVNSIQIGQIPLPNPSPV
jgi:hypothetical protein